jgi:hypothetical protein
MTPTNICLAELNRWPHVVAGICSTCGAFVYITQIRLPPRTQAANPGLLASGALSADPDGDSRI